MQWKLRFREVSVEGDLKEKILNKLVPLSKYLGKVKGGLQTGVVSVSKGARWGYKVQMKIGLPGRDVSVTGRGSELLTALDSAYAKSSRRVRKYYEKMGDKRKKSKKRSEKRRKVWERD